MENRQLKAQIVLLFGNQSDAAQALGLQESRLSKIIHWRVPASEKERKAFARAFGPERVDALLKGDERPAGA
jgi:hypothetical protein